jgi:hypothetical protein
MATMIDTSAAKCPHCGQHAPIMMRGIEARCTVCGRPRMPFSSVTLNLAGTPAKVAGVAARAAGCGVGAAGTLAAVALGGLLYALVLWAGGPALAIALLVGLPIALISWAAAISLSLGGRWLGRYGAERAKKAKLATIRGLAAHQRGAVTASEAARALGSSTEEADALLTELAKSPDENIAVDVDDEGVVRYLFGREPAEDRWRILEERARIAIAPEQVNDWQREVEAEIEAPDPQRQRR